MYRSFVRNNVVLLSSCTLVLCLGIGWMSYILFGGQIIETVYHNKSIGIINKIMEGRDDIPVKDYYQEADRRMVISTFWIIMSFLLLVLLIKKPAGVVFFCFSCFITFSLVFFVLEIILYILISLITTHTEQIISAMIG
jgi:hypothetical protein